MSSGGKREGSGRKPNEGKNLPVLVTKCFRVEEEAYDKAQEKYPKTLSKKVNDFIKQLLK